MTSRKGFASCLVPTVGGVVTFTAMAGSEVPAFSGAISKEEVESPLK